ncbi:MAG: hypothetical protein ACT443_01925 [Gemmatimonadota bacterium]
MRLILLLAHSLLVATTAASAQTADTARLFRDAAHAEGDYEHSVRRHAPFSAREAPSGTCDEIVGRYCVTYDAGRETLPAEPAEITAARERAIATLAEAAELTPGRDRFVFPLIRYLVRADRPEQALEIARAYARAMAGSAETHMVLGFALHHARQTDEATAELVRWVETLEPRERERIESLEWLLDGEARGAFDRLSDAGRREYAARAWRYADPLYSTAGNELWTDHLARFALSRMLEERRVASVGAWRSDDQQLTVRFGYPVLTTRSWRSGAMGTNEQYADHWDPSERTYFPPMPESALDLEARLDTVWPLDTLTSRSGHAPPTIRRMRVLAHQATVFPDQVRISGVARTDSLVTARLAGAVFLLDSALNVIARVDASPCTECAHGDSAVLEIALPLAPNARFYSAELYDAVSRFAARARYRLELPERNRSLTLSGLMLAQPFETGRLPEVRSSEHLKPLVRPAITSGSRFGIYAEVQNLTETTRNVQVELETRGLGRRSAIVQAIGWVGQKLGLSSPRSPARLGWALELKPGATTAVPVTLDLGPIEPGAYRVTLTVRDPAASGDVVAERDFLVLSADSIPRQR